MRRGRPSVGASEHPAAALDHAVRTLGLRVLVMPDLSPRLKDPKVARLLRDAIRAFAERRGSLALIEPAGELPAAFESHVTPFELTLPDAEALRDVAKETLREANRSWDLDLCAEDLNVVLAAKRRAMSGRGLLEHVESPASLDEIGGVGRLKAWLERRQRKGRFDETLFVGLPGPEARRAIVRIHLPERGREPGVFDLDRLVEATGGYSGAEIEQAIVAALYDAFADDAESDTARVEAALRASPPLSVTMAEKVAALREWARGRCVPAE